MTWFKVDDSFYDHPKVFDAPDCAVALWTRAGTWSARNLTDGFVPARLPARLCDDPDTAVRELVDRGLWRRTKGGYQFHDWLAYQPSGESVKKLRERRAEAGRLGGQAKAAKQNASNGLASASPVAKQTSAPTRPDPSLKEEDSLRSSSSSPRKRGTRIPADFSVTPEMVTWAGENCPDIDGRLETAQFVDHWTAATGNTATKRDWVAAWRTWMRNAQKWHKPKPANVVALRNGNASAADGPGAPAHFQRAMARARAREQEEGLG